MVRDQIAALLFSTMTSKHKGTMFQERILGHDFINRTFYLQQNSIYDPVVFRIAVPAMLAFILYQKCLRPTLQICRLPFFIQLTISSNWISFKLKFSNHIPLYISQTFGGFLAKCLIGICPLISP